MFGWSDRPTNVEVRNFIGGEDPAATFTVGQYEIILRGPAMVPDMELSVSYTVPGRSKLTDYHGKSTFPNMEVSDGVLRLPVDDIVEAVLSRVEPSEIALVLWRDADVRERFIEAMATHYDDALSDADRRAFLAKVKEAVHSAALDKLAGKMAEREYGHAERFSVYQEVGNVNSTLAAYEVTRPPRAGEEGPQPLRMRDPTQGGEFRIGGEAWTEARSFWRGEVGKQFPLPERLAETVGDEIA